MKCYQCLQWLTPSLQAIRSVTMRAKIVFCKRIATFYVLLPEMSQPPSVPQSSFHTILSLDPIIERISENPENPHRTIKANFRILEEPCACTSVAVYFWAALIGSFMMTKMPTFWEYFTAEWIIRVTSESANMAQQKIWKSKFCQRTKFHQICSSFTKYPQNVNFSGLARCRWTHEMAFGVTLHLLF